LAEIHIKGLDYLIKNKRSFILNCGYGKGYSVLQIVNVLKKINQKLKINFVQRRPGDIAQIYSNTKKFKKLLKWKPKYNNINKIIKSAIIWERKLLKNR
jgi:UDP-glucose 4-epimerase